MVTLVNLCQGICAACSGGSLRTCGVLAYLMLIGYPEADQRQWDVCYLPSFAWRNVTKATHEKRVELLFGWRVELLPMSPLMLWAHIESGVVSSIWHPSFGDRSRAWDSPDTRGPNRQAVGVQRPHTREGCARYSAFEV